MGKTLDAIEQRAYKAGWRDGTLKVLRAWEASVDRSRSDELEAYAAHFRDE